MDVVSLQDVANIAVFVAPGYFAIQIYRMMFAKYEKGLSNILVESVALSLPIVGLYNAAWHGFGPDRPIVVTGISYLVPLLTLTVLFAYGYSRLRKMPRINHFGRKLEIPGPDNDFLRSQIDRLQKNTPVTVTLKNGEAFSGVPAHMEVHKPGYPQTITFHYVAWYKEIDGASAWDNRAGSLIISTTDMAYIETAQQIKD